MTSLPETADEKRRRRRWLRLARQRHGGLVRVRVGAEVEGGGGVGVKVRVEG